MQNLWKASGFLNLVFDIFAIFNLSKYMPRINYSMYIASIYVMDFIILLIILDVLFVSYSFSKKKFSIMWPLDLLRSVASLFVTVFFLPITETLLSIVQCESDSNGNLVLNYFPDVICWQGWHLVHALIASLFTLIFVIFSCIVSLMFFEPMMSAD